MLYRQVLSFLMVIHSIAKPHEFWLMRAVSLNNRQAHVDKYSLDTGKQILAC